MINRHKGQIRVGQSGPIVVGNLPSEQSPTAQQKSPKTVQKLQKPPIVQKSPVVIQLDYNNINIEKFNILVDDNKASGRSWFHGLEGTWWWGMAEEYVRKKLMDTVKNRVTDGYRKILKREPDPGGFKHFVSQISSGKISKERFLEILRTSKEYKRNLKIININRQEAQRSNLGPIKDNGDIKIIYNPLRNKNTINFFPIAPKNSGYEILANNIHKYLVRYGYTIIKPTIERDDIVHNKVNISNILYTDISIVLSMAPYFFKTNSKINIGYSMIEATKIPMSWVDRCNLMDKLFVPCKANVDAFRSCGVKVPIDIIPIGVDTNIYDPALIGDNEKFIFDNKYPNINSAYKFLVVNNGQQKKNNEMIIRAFHEEFADKIIENKIYLVMRTHRKYNGKNVLYIKKFLDDTSLRLLIYSCDCMVNVSSGEAGDIPILSGMAMEKPVIVSDGFVHAEYIKDMTTGFIVDIEKWIPAYSNPENKNIWYLKGLKDALWVKPDIKSLKGKMRYVYEHRKESKEIGKNAREYILENRTMKKSVEKMIDAFRNIDHTKNINTKEYWDNIWKKEGVNTRNIHRNKPYLYDEILNYIKDGDSVLDIGCGVGIFLRYIDKRRKNIKSYGIDISSEAIKLLQSINIDGECYKIPDSNIYNRKIGKFATIDIKTGKNNFNVVTAIQTLEHIPCEESLLEHMIYLSKKDGTCIVTVPNDKFPSCEEHLHVCTVESLKSLLNKYWYNIKIIPKESNFIAIMTNPKI